jgi:probable F420-dependent oxidoreductase
MLGALITGSAPLAKRRTTVKLDVGMLTHDLGSIADYARKVEAMGYDCLWSAETQHDPYLPLAVAATSTTRIKLGTNIATVFSRSPMITALTAWDLQKASGGRFTLGLGTQVKAHNERRFSVKYESPGPKMAEAIQAMRAIWDCFQNGTPLNFKGRFYTFDVMSPFFNPGPIAHPKIPVFIAAVNPLMCRVAGEFCEGMHVHPFNSATYLREVVHPAVAEGLRRSGRSRKDFTFATASFVVVGDTPAEREAQARMVKQQIAFYASTRTYQPVLAVHGWQDLTPQLHRKSIEQDWEGMTSLITDEMLDTYAVIATYDTLAARLKERYAGLLDRTALYQPYQPNQDDPRLPGLVKAMNG